MKVYAHVNNCVIKEDENNRFWAYDRSNEKLCASSFEFASDAINFAYKNEKGLLCE